MTKAHICDRCGKIMYKNYHRAVSDLRDVEGKSVNDRWDFFFELCDDCLKLLIEVVKEVDMVNGKSGV